MNTANKSLPIGSILKNKKTAVSNLYKKGLAIRELDQKLKKILDSSLSQHVELANIKDDIAILLADNSSWATRLRYNIPTILDAFNNQLNQTAVKTIRIKVKKTIVNPTVTENKSIHISALTAEFLDDSAKNFNDPELRNCLEKISRHKKP